MAGKSQTLSEGQKNEVVRILRNKLLKWTLIGFAILTGITGVSLLGIKQRVEAKMEELVAKQFEEPQIQEVVRKVAAERASVLMTKQITPEVTKFKAEIASVSKKLRERVSQTETVISEAKIALGEVRSVSDFSLLITKASNDDRISFEGLQEIAKAEEHRFNGIANQALMQIMTDPQTTGLLTHRIKWEEYNLDPAKASIEDFANVFGRVHPLYHPFIINTIWEQERFPKDEKLDIVYQVITATKSLRALTKACKLMNKEAKLGLNILGHKQYAEWWEENREEYNKNPEDQPTDSND